MDTPIHQEGVFVFDECRLDPVSRTFSRRGERVPLPGRLFDTLLYLVQNHGRLVRRDELLAAVWPGRSVDEGSLGRAISSLRTALKGVGLADTLIVTVPGRGYRFGARVHFEQTPLAQIVRDVPHSVARALPDTARKRGVPLWSLGGVLAACLLVLGAVWIARPPRQEQVGLARENFTPPPHSVAVLPFSNSSGDSAQDYLSDGISEELINSLGRIDTLRVAARMSSFAFKGKQANIRDIARQLNVGMVLEGSVQRIGAHMHLTTQLIDGTTGYQVWSRRYDGDQADILSLEGQVAEEVITSVKGVLLDNDLAKLALGNTSNPHAFDAYLSGIAAMSKPYYADNQRAVAAFSEAINADPGYAAAYVARARARAVAVESSVGEVAKDAPAQLDAAQRDAETAVGLAPTLGAAHAALGKVLLDGLRDLGRAAAEFARAVALSPEDPTALNDYAAFQRYLGHPQQAVAAERKAVAMMPLRANQYRHFAQELAYAGQYDDAMVALRHAQHLLPADPALDRVVLSVIELQRGDAAGARQTCSGADDYDSLYCLAQADVALGDNAGAERTLAKLQRLAGDSGAYQYAEIYAAWGRTDAALRWLNKAYALRDPGLAGIKADTALRPLRNTPDYKMIVKALGFPP